VETCSPDADGPDSGEVPRLSEDSVEVPTGALSGERTRNKELSAGTTSKESSESSREVAKLALPTEEVPEPGRDADSSEEEEVEEETHSDGLDSEDSTSEEPEESELSTDKDKDALNSPEVLQDSSNAPGLVPGEVLESSRDSTEVPTSALSGDKERKQRESAGEELVRSSRDSEEAELSALSSEEVTEL